MANGIEIKDKSVAVVNSLGKEVIVYEFDPAKVMEPFKEIRRINTRAACDNLVWTKDDKLLSGVYPLLALTLTLRTTRCCRVCTLSRRLAIISHNFHQF